MLLFAIKEATLSHSFSIIDQDHIIFDKYNFFSIFKGGKVPESAHLRAELNMIDTAGLRVPEGIEMEKMMAAMSPELPDHMLQDSMSQYHPGMFVLK